MSQYLTRRLRFLDWWIMAAIILLMLVSLMMLWSTATGGDPTTVNTLAYDRVIKQAIAIVVAIVLLFVSALFLDIRFFERWATPLFITSSILLALVVLVGRSISGTKGWFSLGGFSFQPVELAKVFFIIFFAKTLKNWSRRLHESRALFTSALGTVVIMGLLLLQPDFGSSIVFLAVWGAMLLIIGLKKSHLIMMAVLAIITGTIAWSLFAPYQQARLLNFINPARDPSGSGYNVRQASIAVGSGGLVGRGLGFGPQSQLHFLPERQTDFIFSVIGEELGFVGAGLVLGLWFIIIWRLLKWSETVRDDFMLFILLGTVLLFGFEIVMTVGMNIGLMPIVGLPLPLVSYGGSAMITAAFLLGLAQNIIIESHRSYWVE